MRAVVLQLIRPFPSLGQEIRHARNANKEAHRFSGPAGSIMDREMNIQRGCLLDQDFEGATLAHSQDLS